MLFNFDYVTMNGVFTVKDTLTYEEMWDFLAKMLEAAYLRARVGIAFNVMSKWLDYHKNNLFHVPFDELANFITNKLKTRNFIFRNDYGLYEYTTYIYK